MIEEKKHVFCLISSKNTEQYTKLALDSFFKNTPLTKGDIFVFINNEGTNAFRKDYPIDVYINNKIPRSVSKNFNKGIRIAKKFKNHFVLISNDIIFTKGWFEPLLQKDDCVLIPSCNVNYLYLNDEFKTSSVMQIEDYIGKEKFLEDLNSYHKTRFKFDSLIEIIFMQLYLARIPYKVYNDIGYLDETFSNAGGEDMDYRIRCAIKGYKTMIANHSFVLHFHGKSTWNGCETVKEEEKRRSDYLKRSTEKWGLNLTGVFMQLIFAKEYCERLGLEKEFKNNEAFNITRILVKRDLPNIILS
jgi:GT2 family glycosyltransferase